jgi:hypothetical protein
MDMSVLTFCVTVCIFNYELGFFILKKNEEGYEISGYRKYVEALLP